MNKDEISFTIHCDDNKVYIDRQGVFMLLYAYMDPATALTLMYVAIKNKDSHVFNWSVSKNTLNLYKLIKKDDCKKHYENVILTKIINSKLHNANEIGFVCNESLEEVIAALNMLRIHKRIITPTNSHVSSDIGNHGIELIASVSLGKCMESSYSAYFTRFKYCPFNICQFIHNERIDWDDIGVLFKELTGLPRDIKISYLDCERIAIHGNILESIDKLAEGI